MTLDISNADYFNAADYFVDRHIREGRADKLAVLCEDRQLTYGQLKNEVNRYGNTKEYN